VPKPGVSVLTPAKLKKTSSGLASTKKNGYKKPKPGDSIWPSTDDDTTSQGGKGTQYDEWADSSDDDDEGLPFGQSPPKTMTFHVPQRRLLRTPGKFPLKTHIIPPTKLVTKLNLSGNTAKEASKRIVSDLLLSAGHGRFGGEVGGEELTDEMIDEFDIDLDVNHDGDGLDLDMGEPTSPSVVRGRGLVDDESF
jgi:hypothetical protein